MTWRPVVADEKMTARIKAEYQAIHGHLGDEAPEPATPVEVMVNKDDAIRFLAGGDAFALTPSRRAAVRYRPFPDGTEDVTYWRAGRKVRHLLNPPPAVSN
jgi:hypothetical protein